MVNVRILSNPFFIYVISWLGVLFLYSLTWSEVFPALSVSMYLFLFSTFLISIMFGIIIHNKRVVRYKPIASNDRLNITFFLMIIWFGHFFEFLTLGGIPIVNLIRGITVIHYFDYGIKFFHVVLVSFNSFCVAFFFHKYLSKRKRFYLIAFVLSIIPSILIVNRAMFLISILTCFFIYLMSLNKHLNLKKILWISVFTLIVLYLFGLLGNSRSANNDPNYIPSQSNATEGFMKSGIPKEYFWTYLYGASPLANFQNNVDKIENVNYNFFDLILFEMTPDIISKRIASIFGRDKLSHIQIKPWLTVGSVYSKSFSYVKWFGPILVFLYTLLFILLILGLVNNNSKYHVSTVAILLVLIFFNTFSNMLVNAGIILQLFFPITLSFLEKK